MIQRYPGRVFGVLFAAMAAFFALSYPGRNDKHGAWMYISGVSWIGFLLCALAMIVLAVFTVAIRRRRASAAR